MKNPFNKKKNTAQWIGVAIAGALAVAAITCLYLYRKRAKTSIAGHPSHDQDYLEVKHNKTKKKKHKTDIHELGNIVQHPQI